jgi:DNA polymerase
VADWVVIDFETRSAADIKKYGARCYAEHPTTEAMCIAWQWPAGGVEVANIHQGTPDDAQKISALIAHVRSGGAVVAHQAEFELSIWARLHSDRPDIWPRLTVRQTHCTMAAAQSVALPGALDKLAAAMSLAVRKDDEGKKLMQKVSKPRGPRKGELPGLYWHDTPTIRARLVEYCAVDVEVQTLAWRALPKLTPAERALWELDQTINARGIGVDRAACAAALRAIERADVDTDAAVRAITDGAAASVRAGGFLPWLQAAGVTGHDGARLRRLRLSCAPRASHSSARRTA